jgi:2-phospho-L-lactate guanylyltransferase
MAPVKALLVPVKAFHDSKLRLSAVLGPTERRSLARELAAGVLNAAGNLPAFVVCDDHEVAAFAESRGASVIWTPGLGLSGAVGAGVSKLATEGFDVVVVAHADLARARRFDHIGAAGADGTATLVPDRRRDGTNVIALPSGKGFRFSYGRGSFTRHVDEARRVGLSVEVLEDAELAADVDDPADLVLITARAAL